MLLLKIQSDYYHSFSSTRKKGGGYSDCLKLLSIYIRLFTRRLSLVVTSFTRIKQLTYLQSGLHPGPRTPSCTFAPAVLSTLVGKYLYLVKAIGSRGLLILFHIFPTSDTWSYTLIHICISIYRDTYSCFCYVKM